VHAINPCVEVHTPVNDIRAQVKPELLIHQLEQELREREQEIELLKDTVNAIGSELDLGKVLQLVAERARELIHAETLLIPILDRDCQHYTYQAGSGRNAEEIVGQSLPLDFGVCGWVWRNKRAWWRGVLDELDAGERNKWEREIGTLILVPMIGKRHFLGGLAGMNRIGGGDFTRQDLNLLSLFAGHVGIAIENAYAYAELSEAKLSAEAYQGELRVLNNELVSINKELEHLALYDQLTQLPNRSLVQDRLQQALRGARREHGNVAVLLIDLDRFKEVNESLGHAVGDQVLIEVAERFQSVLHHDDTLGRLGGDEFALIVPGSDAQRAGQMAESLLKTLEPDIEIAGTRFSIAASIGIAVYPTQGRDIGELLKHADSAMYSAKRTRFGYSIYTVGQDEAEPGRLSLTGDLRQALLAREFELHLQPKIDLRTGRICGAEALARWSHPRRGFVTPDEFIPMLEESGLIRPFTLWAIERGLEHCAQWHARGHNLPVAVNISLQNLLDPHFPEQVIALLQRTPVALPCLVLEITESVFLSEHAKLRNVLLQLREHGVQFSIDDFGTGHSSLSRLKKLPVSELKIDRSFVKDMERERDDGVIVRSTVDLAHNLGLSVIAEGVESEMALNMLREMGCDQAQGFFISAALPPDEFERFLTASA
jgi:diguanylate cyclase (GGDEF)-like protein